MSDGLGDYMKRQRQIALKPGDRDPECMFHGDNPNADDYAPSIRQCSCPQTLEQMLPSLAASAEPQLFPGNRKEYPVFTGLLMYFPNACAAVARCSLVMNEQHNPGEPPHWDKSKSIGTGDETIRHLMDSAYGVPPQVVGGHEVDHAANHAWRAMEYLERLILKRRG